MEQALDRFLKHGLSRVGPGHHLTLEKDQGLGGPWQL